MIDAYGLADSGYRYRTDTEQEWADALREAVAAREWVVHPSWQPQYLNYDYNVRPLSESKKLLGEANTATLIAYRDFPDVVPDETVEALSRVSLGLETVTELDYWVSIEDKTPETAADAWFDVHPETVEWWLTGDTRD
jgi:glycine betaine/proline transport system substrate-binding protein